MEKEKGEGIFVSWEMRKKKEEVSSWRRRRVRRT
jgi:hypothetical protein